MFIFHKGWENKYVCQSLTYMHDRLSQLVVSQKRKEKEKKKIVGIFTYVCPITRIIDEIGQSVRTYVCTSVLSVCLSVSPFWRGKEEYTYIKSH